MQVFSGTHNTQIISLNNTLFLDWLFDYKGTPSNKGTPLFSHFSGYLDNHICAYIEDIWTQ